MNLIPTLINVGFNFSPKKNRDASMYPMNEMFERSTKDKFPLTIKVDGSQIKSIEIQSVKWYKAGGRGAMQRQRMGVELEKRIVRMKGPTGVLNGNLTNETKGSLEIETKITFANGSVNEKPSYFIVEGSGNVGLRTSAKGFEIDPKNPRMFHDGMREIERVILRFLGIRKNYDYHIFMINFGIRLFKNKRIDAFEQFIKELYKQGLSEKYRMCDMPWLRQQGRMIKCSFKARTSSNELKYPGLGLTRNGYVELLGATSFEVAIKAYKLFMNAYKKSNIKMSDIAPNHPTSTRKYDKQIIYTNINTFDNDDFHVHKDRLFIKNKECIKTYKKQTLQKIAQHIGQPHKGTKLQLCDVIKKYISNKKNLIRRIPLLIIKVFL